MANFMPVTNSSVTFTVVSVATVVTAVVADDASLSVGFAVNDVSVNCSVVVVTVDCDMLDVCFVVDAVLVGEVLARSASVAVSVDDDTSCELSKEEFVVVVYARSAEAFVTKGVDAELDTVVGDESKNKNL